MKKFGKVILCTAVAAVLCTGAIFANARGGMEPGKMGRGPGGRMEIDDDGKLTPKQDLIGQVTAVDEKNGTVKIADVDGKETLVYVSPFTNIHFANSKDEKAITDIKKGDWVMYSLYNTNTEKKLASFIMVKSNS